MKEKEKKESIGRILKNLKTASQCLAFHIHFRKLIIIRSWKMTQKHVHSMCFDPGKLVQNMTYTNCVNCIKLLQIYVTHL